MAELVIYTKEYCPFSKDAKAFFEEKGVKFEEKSIDGDKELTNEMESKSGGRSDTPQIFFDGHHIGSFDDVKALDATGKLSELLHI